MAKAQALDRVLARVPETTPPTAGLADRILAAALAERPAAGVPARAEADATVLALSRQKPAARIAPVATTTQAPATHVLSRARSGRWQAAAILVFALTTGVLIGAMDLVPGATGWIAELAGLETDAEQAVATIQFDGLPQMIDEEQL